MRQSVVRGERILNHELDLRWPATGHLRIGLKASCFGPVTVATSQIMRCASETPALSIQPSAALLAFVKRQVSQTEMHTGSERRAELRQLLAKPVLVYPADEHFSPVGVSHVMVIRDIAPRGLGLVHEEQLQTDLILVRISLPSLEALVGARVRWNRPVGPFYHLGCEIDERFDGIELHLVGKDT